MRTNLGATAHPLETCWEHVGRRLAGMLSAERRAAAVLLAMATAATLTACIPVQPVRPAPGARDVRLSAPLPADRVREGGTLTMALSAEPDALDPTTSSSLYTRYVMETMCRKLYDIDGEGGLVPQLATKLPTVSPDGRTVTIPLRSGVRFADGTDFDAAAVVTTLRRNLTKKDSSRVSELGPLTGIEAADPRTVRLTFRSRFSPITAALADRAGMIMSPKALQAEGDDFGQRPVCVGPYKFVDRVPQTSITVERDPRYYDRASAHFDRIEYRIITDASTRAANLRAGEVQVADTISTQDVDLLKGDRGITVLSVPSLGYQGVTLNLGNQDGVGAAPKPIDEPLAKQAAVRQALSMSVDRRQLVDAVFGGYADPACSPIPPASDFASRAAEACPPYSPAKAKRMLAAAGVRTPFRVEVKTANTPESLRFAQALQAQVAKGGFDLRIVPVEYTTLLDDQTAGRFDAVLLGWSGRVDPNGNTFNFLATKASSNYSGYSSAAVDDLLTRAASAGSLEERRDLYGQAQARLLQDVPIAYLYRPYNLTALSDAVAGVAAYPDGVVRLSRAAFVEDR